MTGGGVYNEIGADRGLGEGGQLYRRAFLGPWSEPDVSHSIGFGSRRRLGDVTSAHDDLMATFGQSCGKSPSGEAGTDDGNFHGRGPHFRWRGYF
jgi:hypothetical protein